MKLEEIRHLLSGRLAGDPNLEISGVNSIDAAKEGEITFLTHKKYLALLQCSGYSAIIAQEGMELGAEKSVIYVENPSLAFATLLETWYPPKKEIPGVSPQSFIAETATLSKGVTIHPMVYVGDRAQIGENTVLFPGVYIGEDTTIGAQGVIHANVSVYPGAVIGNRVTIHAGAVVGSDGFGYIPDDKGKRLKMPQVGNVVIEDDVELGANTCIDRGTIGSTRILRGVKLDNLVQIAHNCVIGEDSVMAAQAGVAGSCAIGKRAMLGGQVGVADHVEIGDNVMIVGQSGVPSDLEGGQTYAGTPTVKHNIWRRIQMSLPKLPDLVKKVRAMEKRIEALEKND